MPSFFSTTRERFREYWDRLSHGEQKRFVTVAILVVLIVVAVPAAFLFKPAWNKWRHRQALRQASQFAVEHDYRNLLLALQRATQLAPGDSDTWREVARHLADIDLRNTLVARENVVRLAPDDLSARLAFATDALRFGQVAQARDAINQAGERAVTDAAYQRIAATLAMTLGDTEAVEQHLETLIKLEAANGGASASARFNLAIVRLWSPDPVRRSAALTELETLLAEPDVQIPVALELLKHAARQRDANRAAVVARLIGKNLKAEGLKAEEASPDAATPTFDQLAATLKRAASRRPSDVSLLARWLGDIRRGPEALFWIDSLPESTRRDRAVLSITTELAAEADDLPRAIHLIHEGALGGVDGGMALLAVAARQQRLLGKEARARETWTDAINAALASSPDIGNNTLAILARLASAWREPDWTEAALEAVIHRQPGARWAYAALRDQFIARGQTARLWALAERWLAAEPGDASVVNLWIRTGIALVPAPANFDTRARVLLEQAAAVPASHPALLAAARAAWLRRNHKIDDAAAVLDRLTPAQRSLPEVAYWAALIYSAKGRRTDAENATEAAKKLILLPEERRI
ncbi:hypothetical protein Ga0100231_017665 [Opitutaceae bacterium TAV4]|nr:hypothetical protein Ga0100231_017665 [Opitutaceae bacterium TAV4]RRJ99176.1 hypothetical protein Ga0100230_013190 [Opitutaceae bacterium TAV3]